MYTLRGRTLDLYRNIIPGTEYNIPPDAERTTPAILRTILNNEPNQITGGVPGETENVDARNRVRFLTMVDLAHLLLLQGISSLLWRVEVD